MLDIDLVDRAGGGVSHVAKDGEHQHPRQQARQGVHHAGDEGVSYTVMVELVIGS